MCSYIGASRAGGTGSPPAPHASPACARDGVAMHRSVVMWKCNAHALGDLLQPAGSTRRQRYALDRALVVRAVAAFSGNQDFGVRMRARQRLHGSYQLVDASAENAGIRERADVDRGDDAVLRVITAFTREHP